MRVRTMAAFAAGVVVAAAGTAMAATKVAAVVGPDNRINGCYLTGAGLLRVVPAGTACRPGESPIAWSATGNGAPGPAGPKGDPGVTWRGNWVSGTVYSGGDLVRSGGKIWIRQSGVVACLVDKPCSWTISPGGSAGWSVFAMDGAAGAAGPKGDTGPRGPAGPAGGVSGYKFVSTGTVQRANYPESGLYAACPAGKRVVGGGHFVSNGTVVGSHPVSGRQGTDGWLVQVDWNLVGGGSVRAQAICVDG